MCVRTCVRVRACVLACVCEVDGNIILECSRRASYVNPTGIDMGLHMHVDEEDVKCLYKCVNSKMESSSLVAMGDGGLPFWGGG